MITFQVFDGYSDTGETHFEMFKVSRIEAAKLLRAYRKSAAYIERRSLNYYVEPL